MPKIIFYYWKNKKYGKYPALQSNQSCEGTDPDDKVNVEAGTSRGRQQELKIFIFGQKYNSQNRNSSPQPPDWASFLAVTCTLTCKYKETSLSSLNELRDLGRDCRRKGCVLNKADRTLAILLNSLFAAAISTFLLTWQKFQHPSSIPTWLIGAIVRSIYQYSPWINIFWFFNLWHKNWDYKIFFIFSMLLLHVHHRI